jgi:predicted secreted acid phosphatase
MRTRVFSAALAMGLAVLFSVNEGRALEPKNLYALKQEINAYVDSGEYGKDLLKVAGEANAYLIKRIPRGSKDNKKLAIVFDIDETTLSNLRHIRENDYGYLPKIWDSWVADGMAPAIQPVQIVYDTAVRGGVEVFFITGRKVSDAPGTEKNLRAVGYEKWVKIHYKPNESKETSRAFKIGVRRQIEADGYVIIANIGDQTSDLLGGHAEKTFKLPNPFYIAN